MKNKTYRVEVSNWVCGEDKVFTLGYFKYKWSAYLRAWVYVNLTEYARATIYKRETSN